MRGIDDSSPVWMCFLFLVCHENIFHWDSRLRPIDDCKLACFLCKYLVKMAFITFCTFSTLKYCYSYFGGVMNALLFYTLCIHSTVKLWIIFGHFICIFFYCWMSCMNLVSCEIILFFLKKKKIKYNGVEWSPMGSMSSQWHTFQKLPKTWNERNPKTTHDLSNDRLIDDRERKRWNFSGNVISSIFYERSLDLDMTPSSDDCNQLPIRHCHNEQQYSKWKFLLMEMSYFFCNNNIEWDWIANCR